MVEWIGSKRMQSIFRWSALALVSFAVFIFAVTELLGPEDISRPLARVLFQVLAGLFGVGGALATSILFMGMLLFCLLRDCSPLWKRVIWAIAMLGVNLIAALPYYLLVYRRQVQDELV